MFYVKMGSEVAEILGHRRRRVSGQAVEATEPMLGGKHHV
jgi:hypothetical protein